MRQLRKTIKSWIWLIFFLYILGLKFMEAVLTRCLLATYLEDFNAKSKFAAIATAQEMLNYPLLIKPNK